MPLYDYFCGNCNNKFEKILKYDDRFLPESLPCENCGELSVKYGIYSPIDWISPERIDVLKAKMIPDGFRDNVLSRIQERAAGNNMDITLSRS